MIKGKEVTFDTTRRVESYFFDFLEKEKDRKKKEELGKEEEKKDRIALICPVSNRELSYVVCGEAIEKLGEYVRVGLTFAYNQQQQQKQQQQQQQQETQPLPLTSPHQVIGLYMDRSLELILSLFATLKSRAIFLPMDPSYPLSRLQQMVQTARPSLLLVSPSRVADLPALFGVDGDVGESNDRGIGVPSLIINPSVIIQMELINGTSVPLSHSPFLPTPPSLLPFPPLPPLILFTSFLPLDPLPPPSPSLPPISPLFLEWLGCIPFSPSPPPKCVVLRPLFPLLTPFGKFLVLFQEGSPWLSFPPQRKKTLRD